VTMINPRKGLARAVENVRFLAVHSLLSEREKQNALRRIRKMAERCELEAYEPEQFRIAFRKARGQ
jgi:hypothetical protein